MSDTVRVNGEDQILTASTIAELLRARGIALSTRFLAVAINGAVVPRRGWDEAKIGNGDKVEIVSPLQGG